MDDLTQRDLSRIPESNMTAAEQREFARRKNEFLAILRKKGGLPSPETEPKAEKPVQRWDPLSMARRRG